MWEKVIYNVCMFWHMFLWRLNGILNDLKDIGQIPSLGTSSVISWYPGRGVVVSRGTRPVRTENVDSLNYTIFLHAYYAMEFCHFPLPL